MTMPRPSATHTREEVLKALQQQADATGAFGVRKIGFFGSVARGEGGSSSDLDFRVELVAKSPEDFTGVIFNVNMTPMVKTQVYLRPEELDALHHVAARSGRSVADLIREAIRRVWLRPPSRGPVALWDGEPKRSSVDHDSIYDEP